jgi:hypothetical protein
MSELAIRTERSFPVTIFSSLDGRKPLHLGHRNLRPEKPNFTICEANNNSFPVGAAYDIGVNGVDIQIAWLHPMKSQVW